MPGAARRRRLHPVVDGYDEIEVASIDSFPASDPPAAPASPRTPRRRGAKQHK